MNIFYCLKLWKWSFKIHFRIPKNLVMPIWIYIFLDLYYGIFCCRKIIMQYPVLVSALKTYWISLKQKSSRTKKKTKQCIQSIFSYLCNSIERWIQDTHCNSCRSCSCRHRTSRRPRIHPLCTTNGTACSCSSWSHNRSRR